MRAGVQQQHGTIATFTRLGFAADQLCQRAQREVLTVELNVAGIVQRLHLIDLEFAHQRNQRSRQRPGLATGAGKYNLR